MHVDTTGREAGRQAGIQASGQTGKQTDGQVGRYYGHMYELTCAAGSFESDASNRSRESTDN